MSDQEKKNPVVVSEASSSFDAEVGHTYTGKPKYTIKRTLRSRNLHLIAIGGAIGTALFVNISSALRYGGPLGLLLAFAFWTAVIYGVTVSCGEYVCYLPVEMPFMQIGGRCIDDAYEFVVSLNYWIMISVLIPFEITAVNGMIHYWRDDYSPAITFCIQIVIYTVLNLLAVRVFGEAEFFLSIGKLILATGLLFFTFITMVGGNPQHDAFGFRYWKDPGPFVETFTTGSMGHFHGFMMALNKACLIIVGPDVISSVAGEAGQETRKVLANTFRTVIYRLVIFYVLGALSVGVIVASNDETLTYLATIGSTSDGSYSPYIIAMNNLKIKVLPHIVNALCLSSAFSAGNTFVYISSRTLYAMAERGFVPKVFKYCTKSGVPIYCVAVAFCFSVLSLMQLNNSANKVLNWIINLATSGQILNFFFMCVTYIAFWRAMKAQGLDRSKFLYKSRFQPYVAIISGFFCLLMIGALGYTVFMPGNFTGEDFVTYYFMPLLCIGAYIGYKVIFRCPFVKAEDADLYTGLEEIELHEMHYLESIQDTGKLDLEKKWYHKVYNSVL